MAVEKPIEKPKRSLETKSTGRFGAKTRAKEEARDRVTARIKSFFRPTVSAN